MNMQELSKPQTFKEFWKTQNWIEMSDNLDNILNQTNLTQEEKNKILNLFINYARLRNNSIEIHA